ncbi:hypothetical protein HAHE_08670 [Haloferula helveola]|uniref:Uncharacterized protein n=1 Tax=Haloferula helveola TaxID=490095 RepID=A0ABN6H3H6_9BACT|nr:hypothetical protein HAHE_08670 [Haloferula helveola]
MGIGDAAWTLRERCGAVRQGTKPSKHNKPWVATPRSVRAGFHLPHESGPGLAFQLVGARHHFIVGQNMRGPVFGIVAWGVLASWAGAVEPSVVEIYQATGSTQDTRTTDPGILCWGHEGVYHLEFRGSAATDVNFESARIYLRDGSGLDLADAPLLPKTNDKEGVASQHFEFYVAASVAPASYVMLERGDATYRIWIGRPKEEAPKQSE